MDRYQTQYAFWSSFGVEAYEENSVPDEDEVEFPYITYQAMASPFDDNGGVTASIWDRSTSWLTADTLADAIETRLKDGGQVISYEGGVIWITADSPFAQNMGDPDDDRIKRKRLAVVLHFA